MMRASGRFIVSAAAALVADENWRAIHRKDSGLSPCHRLSLYATLLYRLHLAADKRYMSRGADEMAPLPV
ncbi:uncharacterized protein H6S33_011827 [Morchella sextelata]|uniref:uncharacterized protein n=1 Tax=Morchella sextelata TaxID=1174677 RepID=UPI001D03661E|nr:uncharacterized protein H6S33_011827 [Morchella sextelata]KAH0610300.1 hypothetical protein H6S33_011827 [Morchella sextelata]